MIHLLGTGLLRAVEGEVQQSILSLRQVQQGSARAVLVLLLKEGRQDQEQVHGAKGDLWWYEMGGLMCR